MTTGDPKDENVLVVTNEQSSTELIEHWHSLIGEKPAEFGIITVETDPETRQETRGMHSVSDHNVVALSRPNSLGRLETAIYLFLDEWSTDDRTTIFCFDSVTTLLHHVDSTVVFRFLRSLTSYLRSLGVVAHFHLDEAAHDEDTIAMLRSVFETSVGGSKRADPRLSADVLSTLIDSRRRRFVCRYLAQISATADVNSVADKIAEWESNGVPSEDVRERVRITLHHVHLPKLVEAGVVELDGDTISTSLSEDELERYVRLAGADETPPEAELRLSNGENLTTTGASIDDAKEAYWTVYGTARDSVVVTVARAISAVTDVPPAELRPPLSDVVNVDALQRLAEREEISVYTRFQYGAYEVVVDGGEIKVYEYETE